MHNLLKLNDVSLSYHSPESETLALKNIGFEVREEEFVVIVGPSGCGKTTLLSLLAGLIEPSSGVIELDGKPIAGSKQVGLMPQRDQLFEWRSILKNVTLGLEIQRSKSPETVEKARALLRKYGLGDCLNKRPSELSGGMRQRAALIRTLVTSPRLLLLDEPFSALDFQTRLNVCDDVYRIIKEEKKTAMLVTHDLSEAISMADKIIVLSERPAVVKTVLTPQFSPGQSPLARRESLLFAKYFKQLWKELEVTDDNRTSELL